MITHQTIALVVAALYGPQSHPDVEQPAWIYKSNTDANVYMGICRLAPNVLSITCRGSYDLLDWFHDLDFHPVIPAGRPELHLVDAGMYGGTPEAWDIAIHYIQDDDFIIFNGHSLGAARGAGYLVGHAVANKIDPKRIFTLAWGEPRWCTSKTRDFLSGVAGVSYRNAAKVGMLDHDHVTEVPFGKQRMDVTDIDGGTRGPELDPFRRHYFDLYLKATPATEVVFPVSVASK